MTGMKKYLIAIVIVSILGNSCNKELSPDYNAIITGFDLRKCACCGGLMITFNGETTPNAGDFKLISNNPADLGISANDKFPMHVYVEWKPGTSDYCDHIIITKFEKIN